MYCKLTVLENLAYQVTENFRACGSPKYLFIFIIHHSSRSNVQLHQISDLKNFRNAIAVNTKAKKPSKHTSIIELRNVSEKAGSVSVGGGGILSVSDSPLLRFAICVICANMSSSAEIRIIKLIVVPLTCLKVAVPF